MTDKDVSGDVLETDIPREWKNIRDFERLYRVSDFGEVQSYKNGKVLRPRFDRYGAQVVTLYREGKPYTRTVHRMVLLAFRGESSAPEFLNGDRGDPRLSNLRNRPSVQRMTTGRAIRIREMERDGYSVDDICQRMNLKPDTVRRCLARETWKFFEPTSKSDPRSGPREKVYDPVTEAEQEKEWNAKREKALISQMPPDMTPEDEKAWKKMHGVEDE